MSNTPTSIADAAETYAVENSYIPRLGQDESPHVETFTAGARFALTCAEVMAMREALQWASEMFAARDAMNAKVHCAPVRLSPVTERVQMALVVFDALLAEVEK